MIPVGSPRSSFVAKLPSVQTTRGLDQLDLAEQVRRGSSRSRRLRVAVARRAALEDVRDEHVARASSPISPSSLSAASRLADERQALLVLVGAGRLADEHQVGVGVARRRRRPCVRVWCELRAARAAARLAGRRPSSCSRRSAALRDGIRRDATALAAGRRRGDTVPCDGAVTLGAGPRTADVLSLRLATGIPHAGTGTDLTPCCPLALRHRRRRPPRPRAR